jgi:hypothetical protein
MKKINLGCGWVGPEEWIAVDNNPRALLWWYSLLSYFYPQRKREMSS